MPRGGEGGSAPPLTRQSQLADPELLKHFLATVLPPMPRLFPGLLEEKEVELIAELLVARGHRVLHLLPDRIEPHRLSDEAEVRDGKLYLCGELVA